MFASYSKVFSPVNTHFVDPQISSSPNFHYTPKLELKKVTSSNDLCVFSVLINYVNSKY